MTPKLSRDVTCPECGLPMSECTELALMRLEDQRIKRYEATRKRAEEAEADRDRWRVLALGERERIACELDDLEFPTAARRVRALPPPEMKE